MKILKSTFTKKSNYVFLQLRWKKLLKVAAFVIFPTSIMVLFEVFCLQINKRVFNYYKLILWFWWGWSRISKATKIASLLCFYSISKKKLEMKLIFCMQISIKITYKVISTLWAPMFPTRWYYHYWWAWSNILKVLKVTILQRLCNISKKKLEMEFIFCMQINSKVSTSWHYRF